ncbi:DUF6402 family protein [Pectobacterium parmentieri]|nr:DUF6402 family protein [Pectobacterium parmentieri]
MAREYFDFVPVWNSDFRKWQDKHNSGSDFIVFLMFSGPFHLKRKG